MFDKKKLNFWGLTFIFAGFTLITLFLLWSSPTEPKAQMMNTSMGSMMKQMHLSNITLYDLLGNPKQENQMGDMSEMLKHHQNQAQVIVKLNFITTAIIFLLLPFLIGGSIVLAIIWKK
jgi:multisubunit Na+/H+ antiporter MnhB subunit